MFTWCSFLNNTFIVQSTGVTISLLLKTLIPYLLNLYSLFGFTLCFSSIALDLIKIASSHNIRSILVLLLKALISCFFILKSHIELSLTLLSMWPFTYFWFTLKQLSAALILASLILNLKACSLNLTLSLGLLFSSLQMQYQNLELLLISRVKFFISNCLSSNFKLLMSASFSFCLGASNRFFTELIG